MIKRLKQKIEEKAVSEESAYKFDDFALFDAQPTIEKIEIYNSNDEQTKSKSKSSKKHLNIILLEQWII